jgi:small conductance mechanosensitive channel
MLEEKTQDLMVNMQAVLPLIVTNALSALGAIVILLIGLWLSGKADQLVVRVLSRTPHFDPTLKSFFGSLARYLILTVTLLAVLSQFGIQTTSLVAVIGAASLAVGLALQGTLSNLAAGIMLLIFRPFRVGHKVQVGGSLGTVKELSLFWTELVTDDRVQIIVPNGGVWGQPLRNFSIYPAPPHEHGAAGWRGLHLRDTPDYHVERSGLDEVQPGGFDPGFRDNPDCPWGRPSRRVPEGRGFCHAATWSK